MSRLVRSWRRLRAHYYVIRHRGRLVLGPGVRVTGRLVIGGKGQVRLGARCRVKSAAIYALDAGSTVTIGSDCFLNGPEIAAAASIEIGDRCDIGSATIYDTDFHPVQRVPRGPVRTGPIRIGDDVWLAARTAVLRGVTIGDRSVVGLGAVVTGDVPADTLVRPAEVRMDPLGPPAQAAG